MFFYAFKFLLFPSIFHCVKSRSVIKNKSDFKKYINVKVVAHLKTQFMNMPQKVYVVP